MEDLKEMFAQIMKIQMESQPKKEEKLLQLQKENKERILKNEEKRQLQKENEERILKKKTRKNNNGSSSNYKNNKKHFLKV